MIQTLDITDHQLQYILNLEEDHFRDLKSIDIKPSKLTKAISAFANTVGGEVYIGIEENDVTGKKVREWRGFEDTEAANAHLQVFEDLFPLGEDFLYTFLRHPLSQGLVLQVVILKTRAILKASDNLPYIRRGAQSLPINTDDKLKRLQLDKGVASFEENTLSIDPTLVTDSYVIYEFMAEVIPTTEPEQWLKKQLLIVGGKPTVTAVLLFADNPQAALPKQSGIKVYRYKTKNLEGGRDTLAFDPITIEGHVYIQIKDAVAEVTRIIEDITIITEGGEMKVVYPNETLHEIITNAVLHRDYSIVADIHIRIFDNRVEIESPGRLPGHITPQNILKEQFARNGSLVRLINKFPNPPNKDVGEGLNTAFEAMKKLKLKEPVIEDRDNSVRVYIKHESLESPEEIVTAYLKTNPTINNSKARELTGVTSENTMKRIFYSLRDKGHIVQTPGTGGKGSTWQRQLSTK